MKVKVIKKFIDAHDKKIVHAVGEELEITDERYAEICKVGQFVEVVPEQEAADAETADEASASTTTKRTTKKKGSAE